MNASGDSGTATSHLPGQVEESIYSRLRAVEQGNERLRRTNLALFAGLTFTLLLTALAFARSGGLPDEIEASRFVLRGDDGIARGTWAVLPEGGTNLLLQDRNGVPRIKLTLLAEGFPGVALTDSRGLSRAVFGVLPDGMATAVFADPGGATRAVLGVAADASSQLVFVDSEGRTRINLGAAANGEPDFVLYDDRPPPPSPSDNGN